MFPSSLIQSNSSFEVTTVAQRAAHHFPDDPMTTALIVAGGMLALVVFLAMLAMVLIYAERKIAGHFQCRLGPMRVGWHGILQPVADGIKLLGKEDIVPRDADKLLHVLAPVFAMLATLLSLMIIPITPVAQLIDVNIGVVFLSAVGGFGVLGVLLGGWSSNNKWSMLGAMRAGAQIISYELTLTLAVLVLVMFAGSLKLSDIILSQADGWWIWRAHGVGILAFILFMIASVAELNRTPFDIPEGESELGAGFHTEYSGLRFAFFFLSEFLNMFIASAVAVTLFLGGWLPFQIGGLEGFNQVMGFVPSVIWFAIKTFALVFFMMWLRWTFPRLRVDQLMRLEWKFLLPIGFANLFLASAVVLSEFYFFP